MPAPAPERWTLDAGDAASATLHIPADARRERRFEIACAATVAVPEDHADAWLQMTVQADGQQQWQRRVPAHNPGEFDGLDFRFSRPVPVGRALHRGGRGLSGRAGATAARVRRCNVGGCGSWPCGSGRGCRQGP
jgi:hypothetical protein